MENLNYTIFIFCIPTSTYKYIFNGIPSNPGLVKRVLYYMSTVYNYTEKLKIVTRITTQI